MRPRIMLMASGALALFSPALADGYSVAHPVDACCDVNWTGVYGRAALGYNFGRFDSSSSFTTGDVVAGSTSDNVSPDGVQGIVTIGYDHEVGSNFVIGVFGDYAFGQHDGSGVLFDPNIGTDTFTLDVDNVWSVGGRVGFVGGSSTLFYVSAGYSHSRFTFTDPDLPGIVDNFGVEENDLSGYFLGAGVDHQLHSGWFLNLDYRFTDYGNRSVVDENFICAGVPCNYSFDLDNQIHSLRLGVAYKFDMGHRDAVPLK